MRWVIFFLVSGLLFRLRTRRAAAYAEVHCAPLPGWSVLYRPYPELYWDCPWRVTGGEPLPLVLLIKDADRFPLVLEEVDISLEWHGERIPLRMDKQIVGNLQLPLLIRERYWYTILEVLIPEPIQGEITVHPRVRARVNGKTYKFGVTGHPCFSKAPLSVYVAEGELPCARGWTYAETHTHSWQTDDQVEFGAPPAVISRMARAVGLRWVFITDHSFDLDTVPGRWFAEDPDRARWKRLAEELGELNGRYRDVTLIRGEEVSCGTLAGQNAHLLVYGVPEFIPGRGDACKQWQWWRNRPELSVRQVVQMAEAHGGFTFPAHPLLPYSTMEKIILNRGEWSRRDLADHFDGWELWNTDGIAEFAKARADWIRLLLEGFQYPAIAGSDAHGDFNRTRAVKLPFFALLEDFRCAFGRPRTAFYTPTYHMESLKTALRGGRAVMTNGPFAVLTATVGGKTAKIGDVVYGKDVSVQVHAHSSEEFGNLTRIVLFVGTIGGDNRLRGESRASERFRTGNVREGERPILLGRNEGMHFACVGKLTLTGPSYLRVEAEAQRGDSATCAFTNPIWVNYGTTRENGR